jgi:hypothetical protein
MRQFPMETKKNTNRTYTFSKSKDYIFVVNHGGKIFCGIILFIILVAILSDKSIQYLNRLSYIIIILSIITFLASQFVKKLAYKIIIDFESETITFFMYRSKKEIIVSFDELESKKKNGYIIFTFKKRKAFYNGVISDNLIECLKIISVETP